MDDLLDSETGKHDYDWLLTPPGTPRVPALEVAEKAPPSNVPKRTTTRSSSTTRASRLSASQPQNGHSTISTRPARSNSVSRPSIQSTLMSSNNRTSVLNTSISSVSSRPSTPSKRTSALPASKPSSVPASKPSSVPASRPVPARSSTPVKARPSTPAKTRPSTVNSAPPKTTSSQNSRSSTPTSQPRTASNSSSGINPIASRSTSRSSTPTRQPIMHSSAPAVGRSPSVGRMPSSSSLTSVGRPVPRSGRNSAPSSAPSSRPSSPNPRPRAPVRPLDIPDFPNETPPNLRTKMPERPVSAGRVRPGMALTSRSTPNSEPAAPGSSIKKVSVPAMTRNKFSDVPSKVPSFANGHNSRQTERSVAEGEPRRPARSATGTDGTGFGRTISKKSLDMAIRHMDIRQNLGGIRGASLFPHSIRSTAAKGRPARMSDPGHTVRHNDRHLADNGSINGNLSGDSNGALSLNGGSTDHSSPDRETFAAKETLSELDIYGSSRYDAMLLREDTRNTNWLHSVDDKSDQSPVFDHRFEPLPEPFGPL